MPYGFNFKQSYKEELPEDFWVESSVAAVPDPKPVLFNETLAEELGVSTRMEDGLIRMLAGQDLEAAPISMAYAGHQFGNFTMLGDGRAILLGEHVIGSGEMYDVQLKGTGRTEFSRMGDGKGPLGPMLREYIISEALHALGVPTNRSLAVVRTGEAVRREKPFPGAVLTRVASSHIRVGTFEYAARLSTDHVKDLADYAIRRHYPDLADKDDKYELFLDSVIHAQSYLLGEWMGAGFIHGVMNTDNTTISGESIDFGPCAFMDEYDQEQWFSSIDEGGRYRYKNQPGIAQWNLAKFAECLIPLLDDDKDEAVKIAQDALDKYKNLYQGYWLKKMANKLGIVELEEGDADTILELLNMMEEHHADYTQSFRYLALDETEALPFSDEAAFKEWYDKWQTLLEGKEESVEDAYELMRSVNPAVIPRNHLVEEALFEAVNHSDFTKLEALVDTLKYPYSDDHDEKYKRPPRKEEVVQHTFCGT